MQLTQGAVPCSQCAHGIAFFCVFHSFNQWFSFKAADTETTHAPRAPITCILLCLSILPFFPIPPSYSPLPQALEDIEEALHAHMVHVGEKADDSGIGEGLGEREIRKYGRGGWRGL